MNDSRRKRAGRVDQDVALAAGDLLGGAITVRPAGLGGLDALAVHDRRAGAGLVCRQPRARLGATCRGEFPKGRDSGTRGSTGRASARAVTTMPESGTDRRCAVDGK